MNTSRCPTVLAITTILLASAMAQALFMHGAEPDDAATTRFSEHLIMDKYGYAYGIAAADLDGDGHLDLVSSDTTRNHLYWFQNDGKGNFRRHFIAKNEPGWFERLAVGDINRDGRLDVVVVKHQAREVVWFENSGTPQGGQPWKKHIVTKGGLPQAYDVVLADLDGDGRLDVAASSFRNHQFVWFKNPGKPDEAREWTAYVIEANVQETRTIRAADFNRDGRIDLLGTATASNLVLWYENPGKPAAPNAWKKHVIDDKTARPMHGHAVDLDGDGDLDVVMAAGMYAPAGQKDTHRIVWYENSGKPGDGTIWKKHVIGDFPQAFEAVAADLNGDGRLDIIATAWGAKGRLAWFENPGDPRKVPWRMHLLKDNWSNANQAIAADLNGDSRIDIAAVAERGANEFRWWRNEGPAKK